MDPWLIVLLVLTGISLAMLGVIIHGANRTYKGSEKAFELTFFNPIHCGANVCKRPITTLPVPAVSGTAYDPTVARYCADLVMRVESKDHSKRAVKGLKELGGQGIGTDAGDFVFVWSDNNGVLWVTYRGTAANIKEWAEDLQYSQNAYDPKLKSNVQRTLSSDPEVRVHTGFYDYYTVVAEFIQSLVNSSKPKTVVISGHSLGAATATLNGVHLASKGVSTVVYNFGCPAIGNNEFSDAVAKTVSVYRHVNSCDLVPSLPTSVAPNFSDPSDPYIYTHCGTEYRFTLNYKSLENNHSMGTYTEAFGKGLYKQA
jgi:hypothetical protein